MSYTKEELKDKITGLQKAQKEIMGDKKLSELTKDQQIKFCRNNKAISSLAYEAYLLLKENHYNQAASYFSLSCQLGFRKASAEINRARKQDAKPTLEESQLTGSAEILYTQGLCHLLGIGQEPNRMDAFLLFEKAANQGHALAQTNLGHMYENGYGIKQNSENAIKWFHMAAENNEAEAQYNLGWICRYNSGATPNKKNLEYFLLAAEQGYVGAQQTLGWIFENDVEVNYTDAFKWYYFAAEQGDPLAQKDLAWMYEHGNGIAPDYAQASKRYRLSIEHGGKLAKKELARLAIHYPIANYHLAMVMRYEDINMLVEKDPSISQELLWDLNRIKDNEIFFDLIKKAPSILRELLWDLNRSQDNIILFDLVNVVINQIFGQGTLIEKGGNDAVEFVIQYFLWQIENNALDVNSTYVCNDLAIHSMNLTTCMDFIHLISDIWFYPKQDDADPMQHEQFTNLAAQLLKRAIYHLASMKEIKENSSSWRFCALIFIKHAYGMAYEASFTQTLTLRTLLTFSDLIERKISPEVIKYILGVDLFTTVMPTELQKPSNQVTTCSDEEGASQKEPVLAGLKRKPSKDNSTTVEPPNLKRRCKHSDKCQENTKASIQRSNNPNGLFAVTDSHAKKPSPLLSGDRFDELNSKPSKGKERLSSMT